jgi:hypothetical protein
LNAGLAETNKAAEANTVSSWRGNIPKNTVLEARKECGEGKEKERRWRPSLVAGKFYTEQKFVFPMHGSGQHLDNGTDLRVIRSELFLNCSHTTRG